MSQKPSEGSAGNRRQAFRYALSAPVRVGRHTAETRDLSTKGVYFVAPPQLKLGSVIEMDITLPHASPTGPLSARIRARVIRVDELGERKGVAAEIEAWEIPELDEGEGAV